MFHVKHSGQRAESAVNVTAGRKTALREVLWVAAKEVDFNDEQEPLGCEW